MCDPQWMSVRATSVVLLGWCPFSDPGATGSKPCWEALPLSQALGLSSKSCSGITAAGQGQEAEGCQSPALSTPPHAWRGKGHSLPRGRWTVSLGENSVAYTISLLRGICFVTRVCAQVCTHTRHRARLHLHHQRCNKHPGTGALRRRLFFLRNISPGVQLLGQKPYVFLMLMDFSRLISK